MASPEQELASIEEDILQCHVAAKAALDDIRKVHLDRVEPLFDRRYKIVTGKADPNEDEVEGFDDDDEEEPASSTLVSAQGKAPAHKGVPYFWLNVLCNEPAIAQHITKRDERALEYLEDIRWVEGENGSLVQFHFASNPFFSNQVLRRSLNLYPPRDPDDELPVVEEEFTEISWKPGMKLTVKESARKSKKGKKKGAKRAGPKGDEEEEEAEEPARRARPCPSFFRFFSRAMPPPVVTSRLDAAVMAEESEEEEEEEAEEGPAPAQSTGIAKIRKRLEIDSEILTHIIQSVVPYAATLYMSNPHKGGSSNGSSEEDDDFQLVSATSTGEGAGADRGALPLPVRRRLHALGYLQQRGEASRGESRRSVMYSQRELDTKVAAACARRRAVLINGGFDAIPKFWLKAMKGGDATSQAVHRRDKHALEHLLDVRCMRQRRTPGEPQGETFTVEFEFVPNPHFANQVLRKTWRFAPKMPGDPNPTQVVGTEETPVQWTGTRLTHAGEGGKPTNSFFWLFEPDGARRVFGIPGQGRGPEREAGMREEQLIEELERRLVTRPCRLYGQVHEDIDDAVMDSGDDSDDEEIEGMGRPSGKGKKRRGWWFFPFSGRTFLWGLLAVFLGSQLYMFIESLTGRRRR